MTAFFPIGSYESAEFCERTSAPAVRRALIELAAAGLLRAYAQTIEISDASGICNVAHGAALPVFIWNRIIDEGAADDLWSGQTVHLEGSNSIGGLPTIRMTGIGFSKNFIHRVVDQGNRLACGLPARLAA